MKITPSRLPRWLAPAQWHGPRPADANIEDAAQGDGKISIECVRAQATHAMLALPIGSSAGDIFASLAPKRPHLRAA